MKEPFDIGDLINLDLMDAQHPRLGKTVGIVLDKRTHYRLSIFVFCVFPDGSIMNDWMNPHTFVKLR